MPIDITVIVEDTSTRRGFWGEHGLAFWVTGGNEPFLFDTGAGHCLLHNAELLGIDLTSAGRVLLSHGHDDHTGGLEAFLRHVGSAEVIACPGVWDRKYRIAGAAAPQYIGAPLGEAQYADLGAKYTYLTGPAEIAPGIWASGPVPRTTDFEVAEPTLFRQTPKGTYEPDPALDDQSIAIVTPRGLAVLLGCAHAGVINILRNLTAVTGVVRVHTVIGGPHLLRSGDDVVARVASELKDFGVTKLAFGHCVGARQSHLLFQTFGEQLVTCETGTTFRLE